MRLPQYSRIGRVEIDDTIPGCIFVTLRFVAPEVPLRPEVEIDSQAGRNGQLQVVQAALKTLLFGNQLVSSRREQRQHIVSALIRR